MKLANKTILITGGASGIGLEAVKQFLEHGAKVVITGRNQKKLNAAKLIYPSITTICSDVANKENDSSLLTDIQQLGGIDILYNNAGVISKPKNLGISNALHFENAEYEIYINYL